MPTRNVALSDRQHRAIKVYEVEEAAKIEMLREAAQIGWDDLNAGHCIDVADNDLDQFIGQLGIRAKEQLRQS